MSWLTWQPPKRINRPKTPPQQVLLSPSWVKTRHSVSCSRKCPLQYWRSDARGPPGHGCASLPLDSLSNIGMDHGSKLIKCHTGGHVHPKITATLVFTRVPWFPYTCTCWMVVSFFHNKLYFQLYLIFMKSIFSRLNPLNINMNIHIYIYIYIYPCVWGGRSAVAFGLINQLQKLGREGRTGNRRPK